MPNSNSTRYPLVAIPSDIFDVLHQKVREKQEFNRIFTVNEYVQSILRHAPMFDYLIRQTIAEEKSVFMERQYTGQIIEESQFYGSQGEMKRIRVTETEYQLLRIRQQQYGSDGYAIPISCILVSMLYQWSPIVRSHMEEDRDIYPNGTSQKETVIHPRPRAYQIGDGEAKRVKLSFFQKDDAGKWLRFSWTREEDLPEASVIVGWKPM